MKKYCLVAVVSFLFINTLYAKTQTKDFTSSSLKAMGAPNNPKVEIAWNRYYDHSELLEISKRLSTAFPNLVKLGTIGNSFKGRDLFLLTLTNFNKGDAQTKPALYIDGNIHSNEIQGSEVSLYTAWYLAENYGVVDWITELLDRKTFYIVPTINPDARDYYIHKVNSPHSPRSGLVPRDDDGDGLFDEDPPDDLDGDGHLVMMRRKNPNGRWKADADDPRIMVYAKPDEKGEYELLGSEGIDNDGDGHVNEDGPGYYDPNRNWAWGWSPSYAQGGADRYPFSIPEDRAVADFVLAHENIAGAQSYHNYGGMILRGPGDKNDSTYSMGDIQVYDTIAQLGEEMLPGYDYQVLAFDMYQVWGGELDWFYGARGIYTFSNELWTSFNYFRKESNQGGWFGRQKDTYRFDKLLLFEEGIVPWKKVKHPQYGPIEVGGVKKSWTRTAPSFMIEDMCHRNMAFTLLHAFYLPQLEIDSVWVSDIGNGLKQVDAKIRNDRLVPSRSFHEVKNKFTVPDYIKLQGKNVNILAGFIVENELLNIAREQEYKADAIRIDTIPGMGEVHVRWIINGKGPVELFVDSKKGGRTYKEIKI
jgi:hypothetical protein